MKSSFSEMAAALSKPGSEANIALINAVNANAKSVENKAKNAVFMGVPTAILADPTAQAGADQEMVTKILNDIHINAKIVSVRRVKSRSQEAAPTGANSQSPQSPLIVEFESTELRNSVISAAKSLANSTYKDVFIRPDRTIPEQNVFNRLNKERKQANSDLEKFGNLNSPFRFVIRGDRVRCVDVSKTLDINGAIKHPFVDQKTAARARTTRFSAEPVETTATDSQ